MITMVIIDVTHFERALSVARALGSDAPLTGLAEPLDATLLDQLGQAWDHVEQALREAHRNGRYASRVLLSKAIEVTEELEQSADSRALDVQQAFLERANAYVDSMVTQALDQVRPSVGVGGAMLPIRSVETEQSITCSGSLKATITDLFGLTAEGRITISTQYGQ